MIERALDAGVPAKWVTGDAVYGQHFGLRRALEKRGVHYVLAVPVNQRVIAKTGFLGAEFRADELINHRCAWARARINGAYDPRPNTGCSPAGP